MRYAVRNEARIAQLHPTVARKARQLLEQCEAEGIDVLICQGLRTIAEQNALYAQGRDASGRVVNRAEVVTNAKGGQSYHNYGLALDYCLIDGEGNDCWDVNGTWRRVAEIGKSLGFEWGGDWTGSLIDCPHLEYTFGLSITALISGKRPPEDNGEGDEMTPGEKQQFNELQETVKCQAERIKQLEEQRSMPPPDWAKDAAEYFKDQIDDENEKMGSYDFWRMLTVKYRQETGKKA